MDDPRDDTQLLDDARRGDHAAWSVLVRRHAPRLSAYLGARLRRTEVVDHLVGESIIAAWLHLSDLADPAGFAAWFRKTGAGLALKWAREHPAEQIEAPMPAERLLPEQAAAMARLDQLIGGLDEIRRMAVELRWRGGMSGESLAAALRMSVEAAEGMADQAEEWLAREWDGP